MLEKHYEVNDLAAKWSLSDDSIRRIFRAEPGVVRWVRKGGRRPYVILRIPQSVAERVYRRLTAAAR